MLRDQALLEFADLNFSQDDFLLYFYKWDCRCVSLGKIQRNSTFIIEEAKQKNIPVIKRPSGGRAVIHGEDICFSFITKQNNKKFGGSLLESYSKIMSFVLEYLNKFLWKYYNWDSQIALKVLDKNCFRDDHDLNCFSSSINCEGVIEIEDDELKVLGSAQTMYVNSFLQQGSLMMNNKSEIKAEDRLSFERNYKSITDIYNNSVNVDLEELSHKLNEYQSNEYKGLNKS